MGHSLHVPSCSAGLGGRCAGEQAGFAFLHGMALKKDERLQGKDYVNEKSVIWWES